MPRFVIEVDSTGALQNVQRLGSGVEAMGRQFAEADGKIREFEKGVTSFRRAVLGVQSILAGFGLAELIKDVIKVNTEFERVRTSLLSSSDNALAAAANFNWLRKAAADLGLPISKVGLEYTRLSNAAKGTALEGEPVRDIFVAVGKAAQVMGISNINTSRTFLALTEMLSKGVVQSKEARRQFGQDLPGGFRILAQAAGYEGVNGIEKFTAAIKKGGVDAISTLMNLPKVLNDRFGPAFDAALTSPNRAIGMFKQAFENLLYDVGQKGGFMREFVGMLIDLKTVMQSDLGANEVNKLSVGLGNMMAVVRQAVLIAVQHLQLLAGVMAAVFTGSTLIGLKGFIGWMGKLAGVGEGATLVGALLNPWVLLASAIAIAVGAVIMFNDRIVKMFGFSANALDWLQTGWELIGEKIQHAADGALKFAESLPVIGPLIKTLVADFQNFTNQLDGFSKYGLTFGVVFESFKQTFANVLDPIVAKLAPIATAIKQAFLEAANAVVINFKLAADQILGLFGTSFQNLPQKMAAWFGGGTFKGIVAGAIQAATFVVSLWIGAFEAIGITVKLTSDLISIVLKGINPLIEALYDPISRLGDSLETNLSPSDSASQAWTTFKNVVNDVYVFVGNVISILFGIGDVVVEIAASIIRSFTYAGQGIGDTLNSVATFGATSAFTVAEANAKAATHSTSGWETFGNLVIGVFLTLINIIGLTIEWLGAMGATLLDIGSRAWKIFDGIGGGLVSVLLRDKEGMKIAGKELAEAVSSPFVDHLSQVTIDEKAFVANIGNDFSVITNAKKAATDTQNAFGEARVKLGDAFDRLQNDLNKPHEFKSSGLDNARAYWDSFSQEWGKRASDLTQQKSLQAQLLADQQKAMAEAQAQAWADQNSAVNRDERPDLEASKQHHKKTPAERAADMIVDLRNQISNDNSLAASVMIHPEFDPRAMKAQVDAQSALKSSGFNSTFGDAIGGRASGVEKRLASTAFQASLAKKSLEDYRAIEEQIGKNTQGIDAFQEQATMAKDLSLSTDQLNARLAAQQTLKSHDVRMTYEEATAVGEYGVALHPIEKMLADTTYQQYLWNEEAKRSGSIAADVRGYEQLRKEFSQITQATIDSTAAFNDVQATLAAEHAVMQKYNDTVFDSSRLADKNTQALYDNARAWALVGGSADQFRTTLKGINDTYTELTEGPVAAARKGILDTSGATSAQLQARLNAAKGTPSFDAVKDQVTDAQAKLSANAQDSLLHNSNNFFDSMIASLRDFGKDASNVGAGMRSAFDNAFKGMTEMLVTFVTTGKLNFSQFAISVIADISRMIIKWLLWKAVQGIANLFLPGSGALVPQFANGGIMTHRGPVNAYSSGGVANSPQMALFGEGRTPEAYVPLPDGRTIPVTMSGGSLGGAMGSSAALTSSIAAGTQMGLQQGLRGLSSSSSGGGGSSRGVDINVKVTLDGAPSSGANDPQANAKLAEALSKKMSEGLRGAIIETVQNELRPGGTFNPMGSNRSRF